MLLGAVRVAGGMIVEGLEALRNAHRDNADNYTVVILFAGDNVDLQTFEIEEDARAAFKDDVPDTRSKFLVDKRKRKLLKATGLWQDVKAFENELQWQATSDVDDSGSPTQIDFDRLITFVTDVGTKTIVPQHTTKPLALRQRRRRRDVEEEPMIAC